MFRLELYYIYIYKFVKKKIEFWFFKFKKNKIFNYIYLTSSENNQLSLLAVSCKTN